jgi:hypothetical protein
MRYYEASSMIASSQESVWAVLTDGVAWPSWDSGVAQGLKRRAEMGR